MLNKIKKIYAKEQFIPSFLGVFINPFYFLRKGLYWKILKYRDFINGIVLDFGCGNKPYKDLFIFKKYIGIDLKESGHAHKNEDIDVYYNGKNIPFDAEYFDSVFSSEVFEHVFNINEILKEVNRVLKPDAYLLITMPFVWNEHEEPYDFARYTSFGVTYLLEQNGFKVEAFEKSSNFVEAIFQMVCLYLNQIIFPKNKYINFLLTILIIGPVNLMGLFFSLMMPKDYSFYNNDIVLAKKIKNITDVANNGK